MKREVFAVLQQVRRVLENRDVETIYFGKLGTKTPDTILLANYGELPDKAKEIVR